MSFEMCVQLMNHARWEVKIVSAADVRRRKMELFLREPQTDRRGPQSECHLNPSRHFTHRGSKSETTDVRLCSRKADSLLICAVHQKTVMFLFFFFLFCQTAGASDKLQITAAIIDLTEITSLRQITLSSVTQILQSPQRESR